MGKLTKLLGGGIGLVSEAISNHKNSSNKTSTHTGESSRTGASSNASADPPAYTEHSGDKVHPSHTQLEKQGGDGGNGADESDFLSEEDDEGHWALDEAARPREDPKDAEHKDSDQIADSFLKTHLPPTHAPQAGTKLPYPVIIPQRRPRDNARGFVRAYAPVLADYFIDQSSFLGFLENFQQASKASPWLNVVNVAALGAQLTPSLIAKGASVAVRITAGVAIEAQRASRSHSYLDRMNLEYFQPRGLYCLVITYKPGSSKSYAPVDISKSISSSTPSSDLTKAFGKLRVSSSSINGELEMPEAAPLVFPDLDSLADGTTEEDAKKGDKIKSTKAFVADYMDRRAQAQYASQNPGIAAEKTKFSSRYADPNSSTNTGGLVSFATGGMVKPRDGRRRRPIRSLLASGQEHLKAKKGEGTEGTRSDDTPSPQVQRERFGGPLGRRAGESRADRMNRKGKQTLVKRILQKDVLYLMIVNFPSEDELQAGREAVSNEDNA